MTTELEQEFFNEFGIKKREHAFLFSEPAGSKYYYPKITNRILLELICIAYSAHDIDLTIEEIKENILQNLIESKDDVKHQIQQLFKEEE